MSTTRRSTTTTGCRGVRKRVWLVEESAALAAAAAAAVRVSKDLEMLLDC